MCAQRRPLLEPSPQDWRRHVEDTPIERLKLNPDNTRLHGEKQIAVMVQSLETYGQQGAVLIDKNYQVIAGTTILLAAKKIGLRTVRTMCVDLSPEKLRALLPPVRAVMRA